MDDWDGDLGDAELLACALAEHPAFRLGAELDRIDPGLLSRAERVDLLVVLEEQKRWFEAAQLRVLAVMRNATPRSWGWRRSRCPSLCRCRYGPRRANWPRPR